MPDITPDNPSNTPEIKAEAFWESFVFTSDLAPLREITESINRLSIFDALDLTTRAHTALHGERKIEKDVVTNPYKMQIGDLNCFALQEGRSVFVSDLEGNLQALVNILLVEDFFACPFHIQINGDSIDRGPNSLELMEFQLALRLSEKYGPYVHQYSGNHELGGYTAYYPTLQQEIFEHDYGVDGDPQLKRVLWDQYQDIFALMPKSACFNGGLFLAHAGPLSPENIEDFKNLDDLAPLTGLAYLSDPETGKPVGDWRDKAAENLRWSDLDPRIAGTAPSRRGHEVNGVRQPGRCGMTFGTDLLKKFLESIGAKFMIRGHQRPPAEPHEAIERGPGLSWWCGQALTLQTGRGGEYVVMNMNKELETRADLQLKRIAV